MSRFMLAVQAQVAAEWRERWRDRRWLSLMLTFMLGAAAFIPGPEAPYATFTVQGRRALVTPEFVATVGALLTNTLLGLSGLFLMGSTLLRDQRGQVGVLLEVSPARSSALLVGRWVANTLVLWGLAGLLLPVIGLLLAFRSEIPAAPIDWVRLVLLYLGLTLPALTLISALALLMDAGLPPRSGIRAAAGTGLWALLLAAGAAAVSSPAARWIDALGYGLLQASLSASLGTGTTFSLGIVPVPAVSGAVRWDGIPVNPALALRGLGWTLAGLVVTLAALVRFRGFGPDRFGAHEADTDRTAKVRPGPRAISLERLLMLAEPLPLFWRRALTEAWLATTGARWWWKALLISPLGLLVPPEHGYWVKVLLLFLPLALVAPLGAREQQVGLAGVSRTAAGLDRTWINWKVTAGLLVALAPAAGLIVRLAWSDLPGAASLTSGLIVIVLLLTGMATLTGGPMLGLVSMGLWWYTVAFNQVPAWLDYAGLQHGFSPMVQGGHLAGAILVAAVAARLR